MTPSVHTTDAARARVKARNAADRRLRLYGMMAVGFAVGALVILLWSVFGRAINSVNEHYLTMPVAAPASEIDPDGTGDPSVRARADFTGLIKDELKAAYPYASGRKQKRALYDLVSDGAADDMRAEARAGTLTLDQRAPRDLLLSDDADLYLRGYYGELRANAATSALTIEAGRKTVTLTASAPDFTAAVGVVKAGLAREVRALRDKAQLQENGVVGLSGRLPGLEGDALMRLEAEIEQLSAYRDDLLAEADALDALILAPGGEGLKLTRKMPSFFTHVNGGVIKLAEVSATTARGVALIPLDSDADAAPGAWRVETLARAEAGRPVSDLQVALLERMRSEGRIVSKPNWRFFSSGDSREAELAGLKGAIVGSFWTMLVTFCVAFPVGVLAAIYLEEFAPKNRFTDLVEVNINNLAAVPSIVFGLLGLAIFLNFFGVPRSSALAGGLVLALMTLPTIIIAARAAIRAVPPSIRDAALGLGASRMQTTFHHVLPLAMPGVLTGTIIGMAQALGETAPLLLIGMVAFIIDVPQGVTDPATVLPVQVFRWADLPERAFDIKTAAAIVVLLGFLITMNAIAIILRKRFERRW